jgi:hypothetical protein
MKPTPKAFGGRLAPLQCKFGVFATIPTVAYLYLVRPMKIALRSRWVAIILATMLLALGCEKKTAATDPTSQSTPGSTKPLEAADLVGYDGKRLRKSVDRIKEANEKHDQDLEKLSESGPDQ